MGDGLKRTRAAARATRTPARDETGAVMLGTVTDAVGEELTAYRTPNGSIILNGDRGTALGFAAGDVDVLRELLDRAAMPGQGA